MGEYVVEFIEDGHVYLINGVIVPSVSRLVNFALGGRQYIGIPQSTLDAKGQYGTEVHQLIQDYEEGKIKLDELYTMSIDPNMKVALKQYIKLKDKYSINPKEMEKMVNFEDKFAGRLDIIDDEGIIWDIKTTSKLHRDALEWQLSLYTLCLGEPKDYGYCIYLPKGDVGSVVQIKLKTFDECKELIERFEREFNPN